MKTIVSEKLHSSLVLKRRLQKYSRIAFQLRRQNGNEDRRYVHSYVYFKYNETWICRTRLQHTQLQRTPS